MVLLSRGDLYLISLASSSSLLHPTPVPSFSLHTNTCSPCSCRSPVFSFQVQTRSIAFSLAVTSANTILRQPKSALFPFLEPHAGHVRRVFSATILLATFRRRTLRHRSDPLALERQASTPYNFWAFNSRAASSRTAASHLLACLLDAHCLPVLAVHHRRLPTARLL